MIVKELAVVERQFELQVSGSELANIRAALNFWVTTQTLSEPACDSINEMLVRILGAMSA